MKKLEMVKNLAKKGNMQKALEKFLDVVFVSDDIEMTDVFMKRYQTGESIYQFYGEYLNDNCVELEPDGTIYEYYEEKDGSIMVIDVTKESLLNAVKEFENLLKVA